MKTPSTESEELTVKPIERIPEEKSKKQKKAFASKSFMKGIVLLFIIAMLFFIIALGMCIVRTEQFDDAKYKRMKLE